MKFRVLLKDPFGTVSGEGEITMNAGSVFVSGVGEFAELKGGTTTVVSRPLTEEEHAGQVQQVTGEKYVQRARMPWFIELSEVS